MIWAYSLRKQSPMFLVYSAADAEMQVSQVCVARWHIYKYFLSSSCVPDAGGEAKHSVCARGASGRHRRQLL